MVRFEHYLIVFTEDIWDIETKLLETILSITVNYIVKADCKNRN